MRACTSSCAAASSRKQPYAMQFSTPDAGRWVPSDGRDDFNIMRPGRNWIPLLSLLTLKASAECGKMNQGFQSVHMPAPLSAYSLQSSQPQGDTIDGTEH
jgi:hypothetical protein